MKKNKKSKNTLIKKISKVIKKINRKVLIKWNLFKNTFLNVSPTVKVQWEIFKNSTFLASVHPYAGFKLKNGNEISELRLGFLTFSRYVYQISPRLHGFRLDASYITTAWNMHRIPNTLTVGLIINPLWPVIKLFNYKAVKNMQNSALGYGFMASVLKSSKGETLSKILSRKDKTLKDIKPHKLTKFEKQILSGNTKVVMDVNGKVIKVITKGKKK